MKNFITIILVPLSLGLIYFYVLPEYGTISDLKAKQAVYEDTIAKAKQLDQMRTNLQNQYDSISDSDKAKLSAMIPTNFDSVKLVSDLNGVATRHSLQLKGVQIQSSASSAGQSQADVSTASGVVVAYKTEAISFIASGSYANFLAFLDEVESSQELIDLTKVTISPGTSSPGSGETFDFNVTVNTYYIN
jgi:Tfp pilus assembly protein PilO